MKFALAAFLVLTMVSASSAVTLDDIVKLSKLKTSDSTIISLLQKDPLKSPLSTKDVVYLKENQVSDAVIDYLLRNSNEESQILTKQEGESTQLSENLRSYYTTDKKGKRVRVVTNLDEKGRRMGKPLAPETNTVVKEYEPVEEPPREIIVTVRHEEPVPPEIEEYPEEPVTNGIPLDYAYGSSYYPYSPYFQTPLFSPQPHCSPNQFQSPHHFQPRFQRTSVVRPVMRPPARGNSAGTMRLR
jgi:hypothetical protein